MLTFNETIWPVNFRINRHFLSYAFIGNSFMLNLEIFNVSILQINSVMYWTLFISGICPDN